MNRFKKILIPFLVYLIAILPHYIYDMMFAFQDNYLSVLYNYHHFYLLITLTEVFLIYLIANIKIQRIIARLVFYSFGFIISILFYTMLFIVEGYLLNSNYIVRTIFILFEFLGILLSQFLLFLFTYKDIIKGKCEGNINNQVLNKKSFWTVVVSLLVIILVSTIANIISQGNITTYSFFSIDFGILFLMVFEIVFLINLYLSNNVRKQFILILIPIIVSLILLPWFINSLRMPMSAIEKTPFTIVQYVGVWLSQTALIVLPFITFK